MRQCQTRPLQCPTSLRRPRLKPRLRQPKWNRDVQKFIVVLTRSLAMAQNGIANRNDGSSPPLQASAASSFLEQSGATSESTPRSEVQVRQMAFETQLASISALKAEIESIRLEVGEQEAKVEQKKREFREWCEKVKKLEMSFEVGKKNKKHFEDTLIINEKAMDKIEIMRAGQEQNDGVPRPRNRSDFSVGEVGQYSETADNE